MKKKKRRQDTQTHLAYLILAWALFDCIKTLYKHGCNTQEWNNNCSNVHMLREKALRNKKWLFFLTLTNSNFEMCLTVWTPELWLTAVLLKSTFIQHIHVFLFIHSLTHVSCWRIQRDFACFQSTHKPWSTPAAQQTCWRPPRPHRVRVSQVT